MSALGLPQKAKGRRKNSQRFGAAMSRARRLSSDHALLELPVPRVVQQSLEAVAKREGRTVVDVVGKLAVNLIRSRRELLPQALRRSTQLKELIGG